MSEENDSVVGALISLAQSNEESKSVESKSQSKAIGEEEEGDGITFMPVHQKPPPSGFQAPDMVSSLMKAPSSNSEKLTLQSLSLKKDYSTNSDTSMFSASSEEPSDQPTPFRKELSTASESSGQTLSLKKDFSVSSNSSQPSTGRKSIPVPAEEIDPMSFLSPYRNYMPYCQCLRSSSFALGYPSPKPLYDIIRDPLIRDVDQYIAEVTFLLARCYRGNDFDDRLSEVKIGTTVPLYMKQCVEYIDNFPRIDEANVS